MKFLKNLLIFVLTFSLLMSILPTAFASNDIAVKLDGKALSFDIPPCLIGGRTMVPLRVIFESLGASVDWNDDTQTVTSVRGNTIIGLTIDDSTMYVNGIAKTLDTPACLIGGRTLVPVRAISEAFGAIVNWDGTTNTVTITTNDENDTSYRTAIKTKNDFIKYVKEYGTKQGSFYCVSAVDSYKNKIYLYYMPENNSILIGYNATYGTGTLDLVYVLKEDNTISSYNGTYTIAQDNKQIKYTFEGSYKPQDICKFYVPIFSNFKVELDGLNMTGVNPQTDKEGKEFIKSLITENFMTSIWSAEELFTVYPAWFGFKSLFLNVNPNPNQDASSFEEETTLTYEVEYDLLIDWGNQKVQEISAEAQKIYNQTIESEKRRYFPNYDSSNLDGYAAYNMQRQLDALMPTIKQSAELASKTYEANELERLATFLQDEIAKLKQKYNIR